MNVLLLLSALLSALSGLTGSARAVERQAVVACPVARAESGRTVQARTTRPEAPVVVGTVPVATPLPAAWTLAIAVLARTLRRRE